MDVLLQRLGRLHRHPRNRPAPFQAARALVLCPEGGIDRLATPEYENGLGVWRLASGTVQGIYIDLPVIELTRRLIVAHPEWDIPAMNRALVEGATHPDCRAALTAEKGGLWTRYEIDIVGKAAAERVAGQMGVLDRAQPMPDAFGGQDRHIMTRLGEMGPVIDLPPGHVGAFGAPVTRLAIPAHWAQGLADDAPVTVEGTVSRSATGPSAMTARGW